MPSHATASRAACCRSSLTKPDFYLSRWSNSKIGYPYLPAHDPGGGVPAAGGPARVACRRLLFGICPARVVRQASPAPGVRGSLLPGHRLDSDPPSRRCQAPPGHCPARSSVMLVPPDLRLHWPAWPQRGSSAVLVSPDLRLHCPARVGVALPGSSAMLLRLLRRRRSSVFSFRALPCQGCAPCFCQGPPCQSSPGHLPALPDLCSASLFTLRSQEPRHQALPHDRAAGPGPPASPPGGTPQNSTTFSSLGTALPGLCAVLLPVSREIRPPTSATSSWSAALTASPGQPSQGRPPGVRIARPSPPQQGCAPFCQPCHAQGSPPARRVRPSPPQASAPPGSSVAPARLR